MGKRSAGLILYRRRPGGTLEVLLVHPGGPYWARKDEGAWFVPKGEIEQGEDALAAARREFAEETGFESRPPFHDLGRVKNKSGKEVLAWAFEGDCDPGRLESNSFSIEWPPRSGQLASFPEVDRAAFYSLDEARRKIHPSEAPFLERVNTVPGQTSTD